MSYSCGIVGLPNAGKSTLFNAISRSHVPAEDFPFCTIDPNRGRIRVSDPRLCSLADLLKPESVIPLYLPVVDIAGLVQGASKGEGLGNRFLAHVRETDVLLHTVRCFSGGGAPAPPAPLSDIEIIDTELILADMETVQRRSDKLARDRKSRKPGGDRLVDARARLYERLSRHLELGQSARCLNLRGEEDKTLLAELNLLSAKPVLFVCNVDDTGLGRENAYAQDIKAYATDKYGPGTHPVCVVCARAEAEIAELPEADQAVFVRELGWEERGLDRIVRLASQLLERLCFFTAGEKEVRAWSAAVGSDARTCAGRIHSDFARGFIAATVVSCEDFLACSGWKGAQEKGLVSMEGAQYRVNDGDVINFRFNV